MGEFGFMYYRAQTIFYVLSGFVLMTGFFLLQPNQAPEVTALQTQVKQEFSVAWQQTMGDQPYFSEVYEVVDGISNFYQTSATQLITLISAPSADQDLASAFTTSFKTLAQFMHLKENKTIAATIPTPITSSPVVSGTWVTQAPINTTNSWVTIRDNYTGQLYCLAIYNGTVNKYLGPCRDPGYQ